MTLVMCRVCGQVTSDYPPVEALCQVCLGWAVRVFYNRGMHFILRREA